ncbi:DUF418 domain-containing protein [Staphylococcus cohnii]|uniref:DUF418 domain-containing protein n=1 Tax=Staphylococcus cohnii TaxID=29382 RepID=UPI00374E5BBF
MSNISKHIKPSFRAHSLDLARGSMLFLIILAHIPLYLYLIEPGVITKVSPSTLLDHIFNILMELFVDNRARPLFSILFGYGLVIIFNKQVNRGANNSLKTVRQIIRKRCWYLIVFGGLLIFLTGSQDILMTYGSAGLLILYILDKKSVQVVKITIMITMLCTIYIPILWGVFIFENGSYGLNTEISQNDTYLSTLNERLFTILLNPIFTNILFPVVPAILAGIWLGKLNILFHPEKHQTLLKKLFYIDLLISVIGAIPLILINDVWFPRLFTAGIIYGIHMITGFAGGMSYVALFGLIGNNIDSNKIITKAITAMGKRSLSFFVLHEVLLVVLLSPVFFNFGAYLTITTSIIIGTLMWCVTLSLAYFMEKFKTNGSLEMLLRQLTYR